MSFADWFRRCLAARDDVGSHGAMRDACTGLPDTPRDPAGCGARRRPTVRRRNKADGRIRHPDGRFLRLAFRRVVTLVSCAALLIGTAPEPLHAQAPPPAAAPQATQPYGASQSAQPASQAADDQGYSV